MSRPLSLLRSDEILPELGRTELLVKQAQRGVHQQNPARDHSLLRGWDLMASRMPSRISNTLNMAVRLNAVRAAADTQQKRNSTISARKELPVPWGREMS